MKVWILSFGECDLAEFNGVYSSKEKAIEAFNHQCKECSDCIQNVEMYDQNEDSVSYSFDFVGIAGDIQKDSINASIYEVGDRIGQIIIMPYPKISFKEVEEVSTTERGEGGFGSTGLTN